jgi:hypothetical protein
MLEELAERVAEEQVLWVRAAVCRQRGGPFQLRLLEVTGGEPPAGYGPAGWTYPDARFMSLAMSGEAVASWLIDRRVSLDDDELTHESFVEPLYWERRDSWARTQYAALAWPCYETTLINLPNMLKQISDATHGQSYLVKDPKDILGVILDSIIANN